MSLRKKILFMIGLASFLLIIIYTVFWLDVTKKTSQLDRTFISKKMQEVGNVFNRELADLQQAEHQYCYRNLVNAYINNYDSTYIQQYINAILKSNVDIDFIQYIDAEGKMPYEAGLDSSVGKDSEVLAEVMRHFSPGKLLFAQLMEGKKVSGILLLEKGSVMVTAQAVQESNNCDNKGSVRGILILARFLDSGFSKMMSESVNIPVTFKNIGSNHLEGDFQEAYNSFAPGQSEVTQILSDKIIAGYVLFSDLYDQPALLLKVEGFREIYLHLKGDIIYFVCFNFFICFIFGVFIILFIEKTILNRLDQLNNCVNLVGVKRDLASRIYLKGNDELKTLANSINTMLGELNLAQTELQKSEKQTEYLSFNDSLTGLLNRAYFEYELDRLNKNFANYFPVSVITVDVDGLKIVNDTFGHKAGDELLKTVAQILSSVVKKGDIAARIGGDEFCLLLPNVERQECWERKESIVRLTNKYNLNASRVPLSLSIGSATSDEENGENIFETYQRAENNMYNYKLSQSVSSKSKVIDILLAALSERDFIAQGHAERLMVMAEKMAVELSLSDESKRALILLAKVHDVGKVGIPDKILFKTEELTSEEYEIMKEHVQVGYNIANRSKELSFIAELILHHHERWDGSGYPSGMKGEEIPLECRILSILDAYDAMTNERSYHRGIKKEDALQELKRCAGTQFEPYLVEKFTKIIAEDMNKK